MGAGLLALTCGVIVLSQRTSADVEPAAPAPAWCLPPALSKVFEDLVAAGALRQAFGDRFVLEGIDVRRDEIEVSIKDASAVRYAVTLALEEGDRHRRPDDRGRHFLFYLAASATPPSAPAKAALLAAASIVDNAIPENALQRCGGDQSAAPTAPPLHQGYPLALALASAAAQIAIIVAAVVFGLGAIRSRAAPIDVGDDSTRPDGTGAHAKTTRSG